MIIRQWSFVLVSRSPLRIGADDGELLQDDEGRPFLPGTSWAGACRAYMTAMDPSCHEWFGTQGKGGIQQPSRLMFSDGICETPRPFEVRPRVALDRATKTVQKHKFEQMMVAAGTRFRVKLTLRSDAGKDVRNDNQAEAEKKLVETMLAALHRGYIRLGANKSTGGGKFEIEDGRYVEYDCSVRADLEAYVEQSKTGNPWRPSEDARFDMLEVAISGELVSPLLIAGPYPHDSSKPDRSPVQSSQDGEKLYIIPGTSFKGALRHQTARVIRAIGADPGLEEYMYNGRLFLEDIALEEPKTKVYHRLAINPLTGGYKDGALVEEETVTGRFSTTLLLKYADHEVKDRAVAALLLLALRDISAGRQTLGSGEGIGRGEVRLREVRMSLGRERTVTIDFANRRIDDPNKWLDAWQEALDQSTREDETA